MWFVQGVEMERLTGQLAEEQQSKQRLQEQVTKLKEQLGTGGPGDQGSRPLGGDAAGGHAEVSGCCVLGRHCAQWLATGNYNGMLSFPSIVLVSLHLPVVVYTTAGVEMFCPLQQENSFHKHIPNPKAK
jgi:hypothetical protein